MKYMTSLVGTAVLLASLLFTAASCIREDLSDCPPSVTNHNIRIVLSYPEKLPGSHEGIDPNEVESLTVYVFDQDGFYATEISDPRPDLENSDYHLSLSLEEGYYRFIAWGNLNGRYQTTVTSFIKGQTQIDDIRLYLDHSPGDAVAFRLHPLFFATGSGLVDGTNQTFVLPLVKDVYTINLTIEGLPSVADGYRAVIIDDNDIYRFDNAFVPSKELQYTASSHFVPETMKYKASLTTMRLHKNRNPLLNLFDNFTGKMIYEANLMELLLDIEKKGRGIVDFERMYEYDIYIRFNVNPETGEISVDVEVNDWKVVEKETFIDLANPLPNP